MNARDVLPRDGEHAERVIVPQILFHGEGKLREIGEALQIIRVNALRVERRAIMRHVLVSVAKRPFQARELKRGDFIATGDFDRVEIALRGRQVFHGPSPDAVSRMLCNENARLVNLFVTHAGGGDPLTWRADTGAPARSRFRGAISICC